MSSDGSLQIRPRFLGRTTEAKATTEAIPAIRALNCAGVIFPEAASACGTSRYSFRRSVETKRSASRQAFRTALAGTPPKANAETSTPVSRTILLFCCVGFPPDSLDGLLDLSNGQFILPERFPSDTESGIEAILRGEDREYILIRIYLFCDSAHTTPPERLSCLDGTTKRAYRYTGCGHGPPEVRRPVQIPITIREDPLKGAPRGFRRSGRRRSGRR